MIIGIFFFPNADHANAFLRISAEDSSVNFHHEPKEDIEMACSWSASLELSWWFLGLKRILHEPRRFMLSSI